MRYIFAIKLNNIPTVSYFILSNTGGWNTLKNNGSLLYKKILPMVMK